MLAFRLALAGLIGCVLLQCALYLRPAPDGGAFLAEWQRYFGLAVYYDMLGVWLLSLPFFLLWLALYRRQLRSRFWNTFSIAHALLLTLNLFLSAIDHEILRFLGVRLNSSFMLAYSKPQILGDGLFLELLRDDRGGAYVALALLTLVPGLYLWWAFRQLRSGQPRAVALWLAVALALVPLAAPANGWRMATSQFRLRKVEPVVLAFATDFVAGFEDLGTPADFDRLATEYQKAWLARSTDRDWRFPDPQRPYLRAPLKTARTEQEDRWNIIYIQLETLRGVDVGFLNGGVPRSATPYMDSLSRRPDAAVWTRALSFGMPSINGIFASHCSIMPPSRRYVTALTQSRFLCLPELLRHQGYRAEVFHADDTDWDNSTHWFQKWYDHLWHYPAEGRNDRSVFRRAGQRIRRLGRSGRPFFAAIFSATNHTPFNSPEPALDIAGNADAAERILNTTHYTDDVLRELLEGFQGEPWLDRTLIVITGDHGFNVGEHGQVPGQHNLFRESVWVPLIMLGAHPRLPRGHHDGSATLLDLTPTLADLLGLRPVNPWQGHSLLSVNGGGLTAFRFRESLLAETPQWSAVLDPRDGRTRLYSHRDWLQRHDLASRRPKLVRAMLAHAERARRLNDYLLWQDRVWRSN